MEGLNLTTTMGGFLDIVIESVNEDIECLVQLRRDVGDVEEVRSILGSKNIAYAILVKAGEEGTADKLQELSFKVEALSQELKTQDDVFIGELEDMGKFTMALIEECCHQLTNLESTALPCNPFLVSEGSCSGSGSSIAILEISHNAVILDASGGVMISIRRGVARALGV